MCMGPDRNEQDYHDEIQQGVEHSHDPPRISGLMKVVLGIVLALLVILMVIPAIPVW